MITYLDEPFAKVWVDESIPCVFTTIRHLSTRNELNVIVEGELKCIKRLAAKAGAIFSIVDLRQCNGMQEEFIIRYLANISPPPLNEETGRKILIRPESKTTSRSVENALRVFQDSGTEISVTFEDALKAINKIKGADDRKLPVRESRLKKLFVSFFPEI